MHKPKKLENIFENSTESDLVYLKVRYEAKLQEGKWLSSLYV